MPIACCSGSGKIKVAICIVAFRNADEIVGCLGAVAASTHTDYEVIICENAGSDAFANLKAALPERMDGGQPLRLIDAPDNPGYAGGVNRCINASPEADAWWVLNPDTRPEPDALGALLRRLARGDVAAAGGTLYLPDGKVQAYGGRWRSWLARCESIGWGNDLDASVEPATVEPQMSYILGASLLAGRSFVDAVGLMREDYFLYGEEVEWCVRGLKHGLRLGFAPESRVLHQQGTTTGSSASIRDRPRLPIYLDERNKINIVRDTTPARLPAAAIFALALLLLRFAMRGAWRQTAYALSGWMAGLRNERGKPRWLSSIVSDGWQVASPAEGG